MRRRLPGTLKILSINVWQSLTSGAWTMSCNRLASDIISSVSSICRRRPIKSVRLTRKRICLYEPEKEVSFKNTLSQWISFAYLVSLMKYAIPNAQHRFGRKHFSKQTNQPFRWYHSAWKTTRFEAFVDEGRPLYNQLTQHSRVHAQSVHGFRVIRPNCVVQERFQQPKRPFFVLGHQQNET